MNGIKWTELDHVQGMVDSIEAELLEEERKAIDALARYKFLMFGYHAACWVHLNRIEGKRRSNPFKRLVHQARQMHEGFGS